MEDIERAREAGFTSEFRYSENNLIDRATGISYGNSDCILIEYCRHEGLNDPGDSTIMFLIECRDGIKGYISSAYGVYADSELIAFVMGMEKG